MILGTKRSSGILRPQPGPALVAQNTSAPATGPVLRVEQLSLCFRRGDLRLRILHDISFQVLPGESLALVGESGCGKSIACLALTGLPPTDRAEVTGKIHFAGTDLSRRTHREMQGLRRSRGIAYIFQDPASGLNPVMRVRAHLRECGLGPEFRRRATSLLQQAGLAPRCLDAYPCELSGGQQQRVMIAMALAFRPRLLIADEPTTALDVITQAEILDLLCATTRRDRTGLLLVTHNLGLVAGRADRVVIMYAGHVVETGPVRRVLVAPAHPYSAGLLAATPSLENKAEALKTIPGIVPAPEALPEGCPFQPRCPRSRRRCHQELPPLVADRSRTGHIRCWFPLDAARQSCQ